MNKDVLSQVETLIAMRTPSPHDRKAILGWVDQYDAGHDVVGELPGLGDGEAWVFSPQWLQTLTQITFRRRRTFDSGATPKVGGRQQKPPTRLAEVDLQMIRAAMAETIERAAAEDPAELRREISRLKAQVKRLETSTSAERVEIVVPAVSDALAERLSATVDRLMDLCAAQAAQLAEVQAALPEAVRAAHDVTIQLEKASSATTAASPILAATAAQTPQPRVGPSRRQRTVSPPDQSVDAAETTHQAVILRSGARRMVEALGRMAPLRLTKSQWGTVAHLKTSGGTWSTYLSNLRQADLVDENADGYTLSDAGFAFLGGRPEPMTAEELQDHYRRILRSGAAKMLDALIGVYPAGLTREKIGAAAGLAITGGTFSTYLSDLSRNGLAERIGEEYRATAVLMAGADAAGRG